MNARRSTATLTLVLIGASALHGCGGGDDDKATRDVYRTRADCQRDWGDDPKKCEQQRSGSHSGMFYGPLMYGMGRMGAGSGMSSQNTMAPRKGSNAIGSTAVPHGGSTSRGGFGSSASAHSSGG
jgi:uncharacterized protein YgiB involved in biofilm formation